MLKLVALFVLPALCSAFFDFGSIFGSRAPDWNDLKVRWGLNPFGSINFDSMPRTRSAARRAGWVNMAPGACDGNPLFRGERYCKNGDISVILIYDPAGYIAGIQAGISQNYHPNPNGFPSSYLIDHPFVLDNGIYYITAYFVDPATLCNGRTSRQYSADGTGVGLWIQNGTNPVTQSVRAPATETEADNSMWTKGKCFYTMGLHYWYNVTLDMSCDRFYPVFLMYNDGKLNSFGWAFGMNIEGVPRFEHPPQRAYTGFLDPVPTCLATRGTMTTLHIFMTSSPRSGNWC